MKCNLINQKAATAQNAWFMPEKVHPAVQSPSDRSQFQSSFFTFLIHQPISTMFAFGRLDGYAYYILLFSFSFSIFNLYYKIFYWLGLIFQKQQRHQTEAAYFVAMQTRDNKTQTADPEIILSNKKFYKIYALINP